MAACDLLDFANLYHNLKAEEPQVLQVDRYRIRLLQKPRIWSLLSELFDVDPTPLILIDLKPNSVESQNSLTEADQDETLRAEDISSIRLQSDASAAQDGSPLHVTFLDVSSLKNKPPPVFVPKQTDTVGCDVEPMGAAQARSLISSYNGSWNESWPVVTVVVACNANDPFGTAMQGSCREKGHIRTVRVAAKGYGSAADLKSLVDLENMIHHVKMSSSVRSVCELLPNLPDDSSYSPDTRGASLRVEGEWTAGTCEKLISNPSPDAKICVKVKPGWLDPRSPLVHKSLELSILMGFATGLKNGQFASSGSGFATGAKSENISVIDAVRELVDATKSALFVGDRRHGGIKSPEFNGVFKLVPERTDLDFTESLWKILLECDSYSQLIQGFGIVFNALQSGELKPLIHKNNRTSLAKLARDAYQQQLMLPRLDGLYPLQMLIELGVEKLSRDYSDAFCSADSQLVTVSELDGCFDFKKPIEVQAAQLLIPHSAIETVCFCNLLLDLPQQQLAYVARDCLVRARTKTNLDDFEFRFDIRPNNMTKIINTWNPDSWCLHSDFVLKGGESDVKSVLHFGREPLVDFCHYKDVSEETKETEQLYYCTQSIQTMVLL